MSELSQTSYQGRHEEKSASEWAQLGDFHSDEARNNPFGLEASQHSRLSSEARKNFRIRLAQIGTKNG